MNIRTASRSSALLSCKRNLLRKGQKFVLTLLAEAMLDKERIFEIYLNSVEWGEGVFGAEAAAQHYFRKPAAQLSAYEAARLAVMLPRPRYFEKLPNSSYVAAKGQKGTHLNDSSCRFGIGHAATPGWHRQTAQSSALVPSRKILE